MKRIEFIAPVEAIRGNLSGAQNLKYPTQDNKAYDGPLGDVNYARNYTPRFIGAKIAASGQKYFSVRTKSANHLTAKSKKAMALMGAAGAMIASIYRDKSAAVYTGLRAQWEAIQALGDTRTFRKYLSDGLMQMLSQKKTSITFAGPKTPVTVQNPWMSSSTLNVQVSQIVLIKFWTELSLNGILFKVEGAQGVAFNPETFGALVASSHNVLNLSATEETGYIKYAGQYVYLINSQGIPEWITAEDDVTANAEYLITTQAPS